MASAGAWLRAAHPGSRRLVNLDHRQYPEKWFSWLMARESMSSSEESELPNKGRGKGTVILTVCLQKPSPHLGHVSKCLVSKILQNLSSGTEMLHPVKTSPCEHTKRTYCSNHFSTFVISKHTLVPSSELLQVAALHWLLPHCHSHMPVVVGMGHLGQVLEALEAQVTQTAGHSQPSQCLEYDTFAQEQLGSRRQVSESSHEAELGGISGKSTTPRQSS